jgi:hypothetical protein
MFIVWTHMAKRLAKPPKKPINILPEYDTDDIDTDDDTDDIDTDDDDIDDDDTERIRIEIKTEQNKKIDALIEQINAKENICYDTTYNHMINCLLKKWRSAGVNGWILNDGEFVILPFRSYCDINYPKKDPFVEYIAKQIATEYNLNYAILPNVISFIFPEN